MSKDQITSSTPWKKHSESVSAFNECDKSGSSKSTMAEIMEFYGLWSLLGFGLPVVKSENGFKIFYITGLAKG
jgi:predicted transcriptional regulator with HTH domain